MAILEGLLDLLLTRGWGSKKPKFRQTSYVHRVALYLSHTDLYAKEKTPAAD